MMKPDRWQARLIQFLAVPGIITAYYLWLFHQGEVSAVCTGGFFDCGKVSGPDAPYASLGPLPVALIGLAGYILIFLVTWLADWVAWIDDYEPELLIGLIGLGFAFTVGLTALELLVIHAVCRYCLVSAAIMLIMFILAISLIRSERRAARDEAEEEDGETGTGQRLDVA